MNCHKAFLTLILGLTNQVSSFSPILQHKSTLSYTCAKNRSVVSLASGKVETPFLGGDILDLKTTIHTEIEPTGRGLSTSEDKKKIIENLIQDLETKCPLDQPARSPLMGGKWIVDYSTAPPPSNGKLGPFNGIARQIIDLDEGTYVNYLSVPGDISKEWLSATLQATFEEWDGVLLKDDRDSAANVAVGDGDSLGEKDDLLSDSKQNIDTGSSKKSDNVLGSFLSIFEGIGNKEPKKITANAPDYGATSWKVDFQSLNIKVFGIPIVNKKFEGTSRIWKMTYLDNHHRIVRAGRTGMDSDDMLFYMSRDE